MNNNLKLLAFTMLFLAVSSLEGMARPSSTADRAEQQRADLLADAGLKLYCGKGDIDCNTLSNWGLNLGPCIRADIVTVKKPDKKNSIAFLQQIKSNTLYQYNEALSLIQDMQDNPNWDSSPPAPGCN
jgi:hypothetical protein